MRSPWSKYFLDIAHVVATRSTCARLAVGAVLVRDRQILATGYNGAPRGVLHCVCERGGSVRCAVSVHAEANAVAAAARAGVAVAGATAYVTHLPCTGCLSLLINAGVERVVYASVYGDLAGARALADAAGVILFAA